MVTLYKQMGPCTEEKGSFHADDIASAISALEDAAEEFLPSRLREKASKLRDMASRTSSTGRRAMRLVAMAEQLEEQARIYDIINGSQ